MTDTPIALDNVDDMVEEDPRVELLDRLAESMATLSEASDTPTEVNAPSATLSSADVDFESGKWAEQLASLQGWLNFARDLPLDDIDNFRRVLAQELGLNPKKALDPDIQIGLAVHALERLNDRLDTAVRLQAEFLQELEMGTTHSVASQRWADGWEYFVDNDEPVNPEPIGAVSTVWPICEFIGKKLNLTPSYQRGDVWTNADRQALIESLLRGIPLPSIILLRPDNEEISRPHEVIDGKQRLTAILRFVGKHPVAVRKIKEVARGLGNPKYDITVMMEDGEPTTATVDLVGLCQHDYPTFREEWRRRTGETLNTTLEDAYCFPFKLRRTGKGGLAGAYLEPLRDKYYTQIKLKKIKVAGQVVFVRQLFEEQPDYKIPVIEYKEATQHQIHEVFRLYNKQGVKLNAEEIRNAVYHEVELMRATLVAAGDVDPNANPSKIAPSLADVPNLDWLSENLTGYGFGASRYKRTKVLSWVISVLLHDIGEKDLPSTARNIDQYMEVLRTSPDHPLNQQATLTRLFTVLNEAVEVHAAHDELWSEKFMDGGNGVKWQELQLVGSLVGVTMAQIASPDDLEARINANAEAIRGASENKWQRPEKTQTRIQWQYIAKIVKELLELLDLNPDQAAEAVREMFGSSGYASLQRMAREA